MRKIAVFIICILIAASPCMAAAGLSGLTSPSAILMHPSGKVVFEKNANQPLPPASVTKVMTLLLIMEAIDAGKIAMTDMVTASAYACSMGGSQVWLKEHEQLSVEQMIKCIVIASANDCATAMAEHIAGTESAFVALMNERAVELGMKNTSFVNACGLDAPGHVTTAYDIALMSAELLKHKRILEYTCIWQDSIRDGAFVLTNTNKLLKSYSGITGLKTGSTSVAGFCISATASRDGLDLIAVVMKEPDGKTRNANVTSMLNYGFATYAAVQPTADKPIMPVRVIMGKQAEVPCRLKEVEPIIIEKTQGAAIIKTLEMAEDIYAPVQLSQQVGELVISSGESEIVRIPVLTECEVAKMGLLDIFTELCQMATFRAN